MNNLNQTYGKQNEANISTLSDLIDWLSVHEIDFMTWGQQATKTPENLWHELQQGEVYLESHPPLRVSNIVQVIVHQDDKILIEVGQELKDKQWRKRDIPPSEKIKPNECYQAAALRCLNEELGIEQQAVTVTQTNDIPRNLIRNSPSYPGLKTQYTVYTVEVQIKGLPVEDFTTKETSANHADPVYKHYWAWKSPSEVKILVD